MARRLQPCHYDLRFAINGQEALDMVAEKKPDVVLLDIMLPEIMGLQVLHTLRQRYSMVDLPIIMVTAIDEDQRIVRALELGANDYISKPVNYPILIARLQTQLSLAQLSALNREFLSTASHDLRKPIAMIQQVAASARLKLASGQGMDEAQIIDSFNSVAQSASYINTISEAILNMQAGGFAQIRLTKIPLQIDTLIAQAINRHQGAAQQKQVQLVNNIDQDSPTVEADRSRIAQVLDHLLDNAIKYSEQDTRVTLYTIVDDNDLSVIVSDSSPALTDEQCAQVFETPPEVDESSTEDISDDISDELRVQSVRGLGLAVCKQLVELHGGEIGVMNNDDRGVSFWFKLPIFKLKPV